MWHPKNLARIAGVSATLAAVAGAQGFTATFEQPNYVLGPLEGQSIWTEWAGNNGAFTNVVNTQNHTPGGSQAIETTNGADTVADFDQISGGSFDTGGWLIRVETFVSSTSSGQTYFLVMNQWDVTGTPAYEWNAQIALAGGSNRVRTSTPNGTIETPLIEDQWVQLRLEYDLTNNSVSIYYNNVLQQTYDPRCGVASGCASYSGSFIDAIDLYPDPATNPGPVFFDDLRIEPVGATSLGTPYCFGDGTGGQCPCANTGGTGEGCANTSGNGALCSAIGTTSVSADDAVFTGANLLPNQPGVLFFADNAINGGNGIVFGDGLRCAGGNVKRRGVKVPNAQGIATWGPGLLAGTGASAGETKRWQVWYRDPSGGGSCGSAFNLSHGLETTFTP